MSDQEPEYTVSSTKRDRVRAHLLDLIEEVAPGLSIPSERQLCEQLGVSRPTLRAVVDELVRDGALVRQHGKGVFVARAKIAQSLAHLAGAGSHILASVDGVWASRTLAFEVVPAGARVARRLHLAPHDEIVRVHRIRLVDGEPVCMETVHLPRRFVADLAAEDLDGVSLYALLRRRFGLRLARAVQVIEPTVADEQEAALLEVPAYSPALLFERTTHDARGHAVEFTRSIYRGDRYRIVSTLELDADARPGQQSVLAGQWSSRSSGRATGLDGVLNRDPGWSVEDGEPVHIDNP
ncbi:GntR family transcriptional regulator [Dactylosporangium sp. NPDC049140]|uniref:GntR family transcriptional regulator n=1 Tax=Dactylosporangium sp. NPDC049140 TaxID=3155647 RepID=UPI0033D141CF